MLAFSGAVLRCHASAFTAFPSATRFQIAVADRAFATTVQSTLLHSRPNAVTVHRTSYPENMTLRSVWIHNTDLSTVRPVMFREWTNSMFCRS